MERDEFNRLLSGVEVALPEAPAKRKKAKKRHKFKLRKRDRKLLTDDPKRGRDAVTRLVSDVARQLQKTGKHRQGGLGAIRPQRAIILLIDEERNVSRTLSMNMSHAQAVYTMEICKGNFLQ